VFKESYSLGNHVYCSICERMFLKRDNPKPHCKCCGCRTRQNPRTKSKTRKRKYSYWDV